MVGTMKYKIKQGMIFGILFLILAGAMLILAEAFKNAITAERMAAARTVEAGFNRGLDETFGNLNHAVKLSYAIDFEDTGSLTLFHKRCRSLWRKMNIFPMLPTLKKIRWITFIRQINSVL